ncbi:hypothetical protein J7384_18470 [Endozoicomonas sp. G2_1]|uniref:hypothetical protein n=1 Tax=Endozoicomonas sp. G2_1 TaxID=2821091 RepID=UPI001ADAB935|nr:hypothetical protein [Endozoicomonas sp. G2_1]MBO9492353.1 hypothetical protein [Endozoicomonas sp. G2_1]
MIISRNLQNIILSVIVILAFHLLGFSSMLFWFGGLLIVPAMVVVIQFRYATGTLVTRLLVAFVPWCSLCSIGLFIANRTVHEGQRLMNLSFFQMPLYSALFGCVLLLLWSLLWGMKKQV